MTAGANTAFLIAGETNKGIHRRKNEDSFCLCAGKNAENVFAAVADGVGGHSKGDVASFLCCRSLLRQWRRAGYSFRTPPEGFRKILENFVNTANMEIVRQNCSAGRKPCMCTTTVAAVFSENKVYVCNVGDSPFLILRKDVLHQITEDHNWGDSQNIISKAIGIKKSTEADCHVIELNSGDRCLLCSDGISRSIDTEKIRKVLLDASEPRDAVGGLLREALLAGGTDNITAVAVFVP